ncbi:uncharacterized protein [Zea mays]|uniref:uncharacterized protein isoform X1 n=1 Tax=Zea mays TaxID=4577 RepID=UPI000220E656|nr:uncharacterized protein LOC103639077 isoform X1 [Zea mays]|eukprot:XP_008660092.1 uncharacterized protein LOC103639077 [Zea mays]
MVLSAEIRFGHQIPYPTTTLTPTRRRKKRKRKTRRSSRGWRAEEMDEATVSSPLMLPATKARGGVSVVEMVMGALRRSLMLCSSSASAGVREPEQEEEWVTPPGGMQIGGPTDVRHASHVTFDRFIGFLDLPADLEPDVPRPVPSARIRGKKAKVNFRDEAAAAGAQKPTATATTPTACASAARLGPPPPKFRADEVFGNMNGGNNDLFMIMFTFSDSSSKVVRVEPGEGAAGFLPAVEVLDDEPLLPGSKRSAANMMLLSDQSSDSYGSCDLGWDWDDDTMTSDYASVFAPAAPSNVVPAWYTQGGPVSKRTRSSYGYGVAMLQQGDGAQAMPGGFDPETNYQYQPLPYVVESSPSDGVSTHDMDCLQMMRAGDVPQDGASSGGGGGGDIWSLDELLMAAVAY